MIENDAGGNLAAVLERRAVRRADRLPVERRIPDVLEAEQRVEVHLRVVRAGLFVAEVLVERIRIFLERPRVRVVDHARAPHEPPGQRARELVVLERDLAGDDRRAVALRALHEAAPARGQVEDHLGRAQAQACEIDHVHVGLLAHLERAAVGEAEQLRGVAAHALHRELHGNARTAAAVAHPVREHEGLDRRVADHAAVRAAVAEPERSARVVHHLADRVCRELGVVEHGHEQDLATIALEHAVVEQLGRVAIRALRDRLDRILVAGLVVGRVAHRERAVQPAQQHRRLGRSLGEDRAAHLGRAHAAHALLERQREQRGIARTGRERMHRGLVSDQQAERAPRDLRIDLRAVAHRVRGELEQLAPELRRGVDLEHRERDRPARLGREAAHPVELGLRRDDVLARCARARELEHAAPELAEHAPEPEQLVLGRERAGHGLARDRAVRDRARRGEAERARGDALLHDRGHLRDVVRRGRRVVRAALAHHVCAHGAVRHLCAEVHAEAAPLERVEILGEALPLPLDALVECGARNVLDALHELDQEVVLIRPHRCEADAAVAHHGRGDAVIAGRRELRIPGGLAVVVGVDVDEARRHGQPRGVERARGAAGNLPDCSDAAVLYRYIARTRRGAGAVDQGAVANDEVVGHRRILRSRGSACGRVPR